MVDIGDHFSIDLQAHIFGCACKWRKKISPGLQRTSNIKSMFG